MFNTKFLESPWVLADIFALPGALLFLEKKMYIWKSHYFSANQKPFVNYIFLFLLVSKSILFFLPSDIDRNTIFLFFYQI